MRKITLLTATVLSVACMGSQTLTADAAVTGRKQISVYGNRIVISGGQLCNELANGGNLSGGNNIAGITGNGNCDLNSLWEQLQQCLPTQRPCPPVQTPDTEVPDDNTTDSNTPDSNLPGTDRPETDTPGTDKPETDKPDTGNSSNPGTSDPDTEIPGTGNPDTSVPGTDKPDTSIPDTEDSEADSYHAYVKQVVNLVNAERAKAGLAPLTIDSSVQAAAQVRAKECEQSFSHTRPNGSSFSTALKEQNVSYRRAGENIAWGQRTPEEVVNAWMNSEGHRANIMNGNFTKIGVGYYQNAKGVNYWSQLFIG